MLKKTITYEDWNGVVRTEDFYFNLTRTEAINLEYGLVPGKSLTESMQELIRSSNVGDSLRIAQELVLASYGVKSDDGRRFMKSDEIRKAFEENPAYDQLYISLATDADAFADFFLGVMPKSLTEKFGDNPKERLFEEARKLGGENLTIVSK